jgi:hypothetical protein
MLRIAFFATRNAETLVENIRAIQKVEIFIPQLVRALQPLWKHMLGGDIRGAATKKTSVITE